MQDKKIFLSEEILKIHKQINPYSCIAMSFELVLKHLGKVNYDETPYQLERLALKEYEPPKIYELNSDWINEKIIDGLRFRKEYHKYQRDIYTFPFEKLFNTIENEIFHDRYVIISLRSTGKNFHNWMIYGSQNNDFMAVTKYVDGRTDKCCNVKEQVRSIDMQGTDIITYSPTHSVL